MKKQATTSNRNVGTLKYVRNIVYERRSFLILISFERKEKNVEFTL